MLDKRYEDIQQIDDTRKYYDYIDLDDIMKMNVFCIF